MGEDTGVVPDSVECSAGRTKSGFLGPPKVGEEVGVPLRDLLCGEVNPSPKAPRPKAVLYDPPPRSDIVEEDVPAGVDDEAEDDEEEEEEAEEEAEEEEDEVFVWSGCCLSASGDMKSDEAGRPTPGA